MRHSAFAGVVVMSWVGLLATQAHAVATVSQAGSGVEARFASQSNAFTASNPTVGAWLAPGVGPYPSAAPIPGLPGAVFTTGNNFQPAGGWVDNFNDLFPPTTFTAATSNIADSYLPVATQTQDMQVTIPAWRFFQAPAAPGYAFEQLNFTSDYLLTGNSGLAGSTPAFPLSVNGVIKSPGAYAQFEAVIDYTFAAINTAGTIGPFASLGTLTYSTTALTPGAFSFNLNSAGALAATPATDGLLRINGFMFIAGDPFEMNINVVPEPASLLTTGCALVLLARRRRK
jgi:hypothetical protein